MVRSPTVLKVMLPFTDGLSLLGLVHKEAIKKRVVVGDIKRRGCSQKRVISLCVLCGWVGPGSFLRLATLGEGYTIFRQGACKKAQVKKHISDTSVISTNRMFCGQHFYVKVLSSFFFFCDFSRAEFE